MRIIYLANARVPSEKAHVYQIFKMCEAFAQQGLEVELWHPRRHNTPEMAAIQDVFAYYGVRTPFRLKDLPSWDWPWLQRFSLRAWALTQAFSFADQALRRLRRLDSPEALVYTRDLWVALGLAQLKQRGHLRNPALFEAHTFPGGPRRHGVPWLRHLDGIIVLTQALQERFITAGVPQPKLLVAPDGVDLHLYKELPTREEARRALSLPLRKPIVGYIGRFRTMGMEKGLPELVEAVAQLAHVYPDILLCCVGGDSEEIAHYQHLARRLGLGSDGVRCVKRVSPLQVPFYLQAFDILVMPFPSNPHYAYFMSPLKLFEYMATRRPIVATDLPAICEILTHERNALLVLPDDPAALAQGIRRLLEDSALASAVAEQAYQDVQQYTWIRRAQHILEEM